MFCPHCGNQIDEKAVICVRCGVALKPVAQRSSSSFEDILMYVPLVAGIASIVLCWSGFIGLACAVVSIVMAIVCRNKEGGSVAKKYHFTAGIICSAVSLVLQVIIFVASILLAAFAEYFFYDAFTHML